MPEALCRVANEGAAQRLRPPMISAAINSSGTTFTAITDPAVSRIPRQTSTLATARKLSGSEIRFAIARMSARALDCWRERRHTERGQ